MPEYVRGHVSIIWMKDPWCADILAFMVVETRLPWLPQASLHIFIVTGIKQPNAILDRSQEESIILQFKIHIHNIGEKKTKAGFTQADSQHEPTANCQPAAV